MSPNRELARLLSLVLIFSISFTPVSGFASSELTNSYLSDVPTEEFNTDMRQLVLTNLLESEASDIERTQQSLDAAKVQLDNAYSGRMLWNTVAGAYAVLGGFTVLLGTKAIREMDKPWFGGGLMVGGLIAGAGGVVSIVVREDVKNIARENFERVENALKVKRAAVASLTELTQDPDAVHSSSFRSVVTTVSERRQAELETRAARIEELKEQLVSAKKKQSVENGLITIPAWVLTAVMGAFAVYASFDAAKQEPGSVHRNLGIMIAVAAAAIAVKGGFGSGSVAKLNKERVAALETMLTNLESLNQSEMARVAEFRQVFQELN